MWRRLRLETFQKPSPFRSKAGKEMVAWGSHRHWLAFRLVNVMTWLLSGVPKLLWAMERYMVPAGTRSPPLFGNRTSDTRPGHPLSGNNAIAWYAKASERVAPSRQGRHIAHLKHGGVDVSGIDRPESTRAAALRGSVEQVRSGQKESRMLNINGKSLFYRNLILLDLLAPNVRSCL